MVKKKKILLIFVGLLIACITILSIFPNVVIMSAEYQYKNSPTDENLYDLCVILFNNEIDEEIIKYFPDLIKNENFEQLVADEITDTITYTDVKNIYIDRYIYACYKSLSYDDFSREFTEIFNYFIYEKDSSSDYTVYLQTHFWPDLQVDKKTTKAYLDVLMTIYATDSLSLDLRKDGYKFVSEWYGTIGEVELYCEALKNFNKIADPSEITMTDEKIEAILEKQSVR